LLSKEQTPCRDRRRQLLPFRDAAGLTPDLTRSPCERILKRHGKFRIAAAPSW